MVRRHLKISHENFKSGIHDIVQLQMQLVYKDGSESETIIEVNLRYPGKHDRNIVRK